MYQNVLTEVNLQTALLGILGILGILGMLKSVNRDDIVFDFRESRESSGTFSEFD